MDRLEMMAGQNLAMTQTDLKTELDQLIAYYKSLDTTGWTIEEVYSFITRATASVIKVVSKYNPAELDLKTTVLVAFDEIYDKVIAPIDIPYIPHFIEQRFVHPMLKKALHKQISGIMDGVIRIFQNTTPTPVMPYSPNQPPVLPPSARPAPTLPAPPPGWKPY